MTHKTCAQPGCAARLMPASRHSFCEHHRPKDPRRNVGNRDANEKAYRARAKRRRATTGLAPGWEGA